ncbi:MAG: hypothetical protein AAGJ46_16765 [Planctomycetota bacterium]
MPQADHDYADIPVFAGHPLLDLQQSDLIVLHEGDLLLRKRDDTEWAAGSGRVFIDASRGLHFRFEWFGPLPDGFDSASVVLPNATSGPELELSFDGFEPVKAHYERSRLVFGDKDSHFSGVLEGGWFLSRPRIDRIHFFVFNLQDLHGAKLRNGRGCFLGRTEFNVGDTWKVQIDILPSDARTKVSPACIGIFALQKSESFDGEAAEAALTLLDRLFLLINGGWAGVYGAVAVDSTDAVIGWLQRFTHRPSKHRRPCEAWPTLSEFELDAIAAELNSKQTDSDFTDALDVALHWRACAYRPGGNLEEELVSGCIALESLAYNHLVGKHVIDASSFDRMARSDAVSIALKLAGVSVAVPTAMQELTKRCAALNVRNGPQAIFLARNDFVHHRRKSRWRVADKVDQVTAEYELLHLLRAYTDFLAFHTVNSTSYLRFPWNEPGT